MAEAYGQSMREEHTSRLGIAWYNAAFVRASKLPPLKEIIGGRKSQSKMLDEDAIIASFRKFQQVRDEFKDGNGS